MPEASRSDAPSDFRAPAEHPDSGRGVRAIFGRYIVLARLGRGGMAEVFVTAAEGAAGVKKLAVVKRLRADLMKDEDPESVEAATRFRSMFLTEAQLSARLNHPNIVHTYEVGEERGSLFIAMEYVEGQSLHALSGALARAGKSIPTVVAVRVMCEVLSALHYAHELTDIGGEKLVIVHRDVSPQNVMLTYDGGVKLVDFGVAKASRSSVATEVGTLKGKVRYMAPEQVAGNTVDRRADVYAAGVVLWELLAQKRMVRGENDAQSLLSLVQDDAPSLLVQAPTVDPSLAATVMRALSRLPEQRYQTALEMRSALEAYLSQSQSHVTSETIGTLVRTTFSNERAVMTDRIRKALARSNDPDDGVVLDWAGGESTLGDSGASKPASRSASRSIGRHEPTLLEAGRQEASQPSFREQETTRPPARSRLLIPVVALLAAFGGTAAAFVLFKDRLAPQPAVLMPPLGDPARALGPTGGAAPERTAEPVAQDASANGVAPSASVASPSSKAAPDRYAEKFSGKGAPKERGSKSEDPKREASATNPPPEATGEKGFLTIDTYPWTRVSANGRSLGNTPLVKAPLPAGAYTILLENPDEKISERWSVTIKAGETVSKRLAF